MGRSLGAQVSQCLSEVYSKSCEDVLIKCQRNLGHFWLPLNTLLCRQYKAASLGGVLYSPLHASGVGQYASYRHIFSLVVVLGSCTDIALITPANRCYIQLDSRLLQLLAPKPCDHDAGWSFVSPPTAHGAGDGVLLPLRTGARWCGINRGVAAFLCYFAFPAIELLIALFPPKQSCQGFLIIQ